MDPLRLRDEIEKELAREVGLAVRDFLREVESSTLGGLVVRPSSLVAASGDDLPTLGLLYGWWTTIVDRRVAAAVRRAFARARTSTASGPLTSTALDAAEFWVTRVRDRLVRGIQPPLPDDAFNKVRVAVAEGAEFGWDRKRLSDRIGQVLAWEKDNAYWDVELDRINAQIDEILDPLGDPGNPAREAARLNDPRVRALQQARSEIILNLEAENSYWQVRATRIARTEATGASSAGALSALREEGWTHKEWLSVDQPGRTRDEHLEARGQVVPIDEPFIVGGYAMEMPGDPNAPAHLVVNCRCSVVGVMREES